MEKQEQIDALTQKVLELEEQRDKAQFQSEEWGFKLNGALQTIERIKPLYRKFYRNPLFWFCKPFDEEFDGKVLMRCMGSNLKGPVTCGKLYWAEDDNQTGIHLYHFHTRVTETTVWEYIKARYLKLVKNREQFFDN